MNFDKFKDEIKCVVEGHDNMGIFGCCFNIKCKKKVCLQCVISIHNHHVYDCIHFDFFKEIMENQILFFEKVCSLQDEQNKEFKPLVKFLRQKIQFIKDAIILITKQEFSNPFQQGEMSFCLNSQNHLKQFLVGCTLIEDRHRLIQKIDQIYETQDCGIRIKELTIKGDTLLEQYFYQEAIQCYEKAIEFNPENITHFLNKGLCLHMLDQIDLALECFNFVLQLDPQNTEAQQCINNVNESQELGHPFSIWTYNSANKEIQIIKQSILTKIFESPSQVLDICQQYQELYIKNYMALAFVSDVLLLFGKYDSSLEFADKALKIYPKYIQGLHVKVKCLTMLSQYEEANKIIIQHPNKFTQNDIILLKSQFLVSQQNFVEAGQEYQKLLNKDNNPVKNYIYLIQQGKLLLKSKKIPEALEILREAEKISPDNLWLQEYMGLCLCELRYYDEAIKCFEKAIDMQFGYSVAWKHKANTLLYQDKFNDALEVCDTFLARYPQDKEILEIKAKVLTYQRVSVQGVEVQEDINPNDIEGLLAHGYSLIINWLFNEAIKIYNKVLTIQPSNLKALNTKVYCLIKMKIYLEALEIVDNLILPFYNDQSSLHKKGVALYHLNRYEEALQAFTEVKKQNPYYCDITFYIAHCLLKLGKVKEASEIYNQVYQDTQSTGSKSHCGYYYYKTVFYLNGPIKAIQAMKGISKENSKEMHYMWTILMIVLLRKMHLAQFAISLLDMSLDPFEKESLEKQSWIPDTSFIYFLKGDLLFTLHQYEKAIEALDQYLNKRTIWIALVAKGNCLLKLGQEYQAKFNFQQAISILGHVWTNEQYEKEIIEEMERMEEPLDCYPIDCKPVFRKKFIGSPQFL